MAVLQVVYVGSWGIPSLFVICSMLYERNFGSYNVRIIKNDSLKIFIFQGMFFSSLINVIVDEIKEKFLSLFLLLIFTEGGGSSSVDRVLILFIWIENLLNQSSSIVSITNKLMFDSLSVIFTFNRLTRSVPLLFSFKRVALLTRSRATLTLTLPISWLCLCHNRIRVPLCAYKIMMLLIRAQT